MTPPGHHTPFDGVAGIYDETLPRHVRDHYLARRTAFLAQRFSGQRIVDVGCGTGVLSGELIKSGLSVIGTDDSGAMLKASTVSPRPLFVQGLATRLPFRDASLDGAVTVATLHHLMTREAVAATIRDMVRITRSGGQVVLWDHNPLNPYWPVLMRRLPQDAGGYRLVSLSEILQTARTVPSVNRIEVVRTGLIPDFLPRPWLPAAARVERWLERLPVARKLLAHNVVVLHVHHPRGAAHVAG